MVSSHTEEMIIVKMVYVIFYTFIIDINEPSFLDSIRVM